MMVATSNGVPHLVPAAATAFAGPGRAVTPPPPQQFPATEGLVHRRLSQPPPPAQLAFRVTQMTAAPPRLAPARTPPLQLQLPGTTDAAVADAAAANAALAVLPPPPPHRTRSSPEIEIRPAAALVRQRSKSPSTQPGTVVPPSTSYPDDDPVALDSEAQFKGETLELSLLPEFDSVSLDSCDLPCVTHVQAPPAPPRMLRDSSDTTDRVPVDLIAVIDASRSMLGHKIECVTRTILSIIDRLSELDRFSFVTFHTFSKRRVPLLRMTPENKSRVREALNNFHMSQGTNMFNGIHTALSILNSRRHRNPIASILVLTDGQDACEHLVDYTDRCIKMLNAPVTLHTFGYGPDTEGALLSQVAEVGNGRFYFVEDDSQVMPAFANCLGVILSVFAQNITLELRSIDCDILEIHTRNPPQRNECNRVLVRLDDMARGESSDVPITLSFSQRDHCLDPCCLHAAVTYTLPSTVIKMSTCAADLCVPRVPLPMSKLTEAVRPNCEVQLQLLRVRVAKTLQKANNLADQKNFCGAQRRIEKALKLLDLSSVGATPAARALRQDLLAAMCVARNPSRALRFYLPLA
eukprot:TRINITY_DN864_c0_g1_i3.p1 TRINITY_DN864_c0_g1~~TRINITY_DN864_c0_g1_i3.p1  ORF type:complete len:649 (-),score=99.81 TRINITY_DN864_c0_g1_i3:250-1986(-)